jgi:hypothetical protein
MTDYSSVLENVMRITLSFDPFYPSEEYLTFSRAVKRQEVEDAFLVYAKSKGYFINEEYVRANKHSIIHQDMYGFYNRRQVFIWAFAKLCHTGVWVNV